MKSWSSTQPTLTLSSGESELHAVIKGAAAGLGYASLLKDLGVTLEIRLWTDSSASKGICGRQGLGKIRHLDCQDLWVQQRLRRKDFTLWKVDGVKNVGDLFTKASLSRFRIETLLELLGCQFQEGRANAAPALRRNEASKEERKEEKQRWADTEEEDYEFIHGKDEIAEILRKKGLPHWEWEKFSSVTPKPELSETEPVDDAIISLGLRIGTPDGGKAPI
jgi:hypothetical protein